MPPKKKAIEVVTEMTAAERYAENIQIVRKGHALAKKVLGDVSEDVVYDVTSMIKDLGEEIAESSLKSSLEIARTLDPKATTMDVVSLVGPMLSDEEIEENLKKVIEGAREIFGEGASFETVLNLYFSTCQEEVEGE
jgi:hypothetical protein